MRRGLRTELLTMVGISGGKSHQTTKVLCGMLHCREPKSEHKPSDRGQRQGSACHIRDSQERCQDPERLVRSWRAQRPRPVQLDGQPCLIHAVSLLEAANLRGCHL